MLQTLHSDRSIPLDRAAWHRPLISIVITHYNYSDFVGDAIRSVLDQSHDEWELVVVDDGSSPEHRVRLEAILSTISDNRVRYLPLPENVGQVPAFFAGLDASSGEFVCPLDPDDRYAQTFLEEAVAAHLGVVMCPMLSTDQYLLTSKGLISGGYHGLRRAGWARVGDAYVASDIATRVYYFSPHVKAWPWCTTSCLMFRRTALEFLRPHKPFPLKRALDAYLAQGCHQLGGTLFYAKPLVYRTLHENNSWVSNKLFSSFQDSKRPEAVVRNDQTLSLAIEAMIHNGAPLDEIHMRAPIPARKPAKRLKWKGLIEKLWRSARARSEGRDFASHGLAPVLQKQAFEQIWRALRECSLSPAGRKGTISARAHNDIDDEASDAKLPL